MIGFFPDPYPDELLHSIIARNYELLKPLPINVFCSEMFNIKKMIYFPVTGIPSRINEYFKKFPPGHKYSLESLLTNHTFLPYYKPFLSVGGMKALIESNISIIKKIDHKDGLKCCPICIKEDKLKFGEPYWHRVHQTPLVYVCPHHEVSLINTGIPFYGKGFALQTLSSYIENNKSILPVSIKTIDKADAHLLKISLDSKWLLFNSPEAHLDIHRDKIINLIGANEWISYDRIRFTEFLQAFENYFPSDFLINIKSIYGSTAYWLGYMIYKNSKSHAINPILYLLVLQFLGLSAEEFFTSEEFMLAPKKKPFGVGPWPCLNKGSQHYKKLTIEKIRWKEIRREFVGVFECLQCGFTYKKRASTPSKIKVIKYGPVWEKQLLEMANDKSNSLKTIAQTLGVSIQIVRKYIKQLQSSDNKVYRVRIACIGKEKKEQDLARKQYYRSLLQETFERYPDLTRTELNKKIPTAYHWLSKNDRVWLEQHIPPSKKKIVDWTARDEKYFKLALNVVESLQNMKGRPVRLNGALIFRNMGLSPSRKKLNKLPRTKAFIESATNSNDELLIRRIKWATGQFILENILPSRQQFIKRAALQTMYKNQGTKITINKALNEALVEIRNAVEKNKYVGEVAVTKEQSEIEF